MNQARGGGQGKRGLLLFSVQRAGKAKKPPCPGQTAQVGGLQANGHGRGGEKSTQLLKTGEIY